MGRRWGISLLILLQLYHIIWPSATWVRWIGLSFQAPSCLRGWLHECYCRGDGSRNCRGTWPRGPDGAADVWQASFLSRKSGLFYCYILEDRPCLLLQSSDRLQWLVRIHQFCLLGLLSNWFSSFSFQFYWQLLVDSNSKLLIDTLLSWALQESHQPTILLWIYHWHLTYEICHYSSFQPINFRHLS